MRENRKFTAEAKVSILREHLQNNISVSELSKQYDIHPNLIMNWRKQLFEGALETFSGKHKDAIGYGERKLADMENELTHKDKIISKLTEEILIVKKKVSGKSSVGLGWRPI